MNLLDAAEAGVLPDFLIRQGIAQLNRQRLERERLGGIDAQEERQRALLASLMTGPLAIETDTANAQHYEVPPAFFEQVLGRHCKYSSGLWHHGTAALTEAEESMLALYCERARLENGQDILELGCGWGSLTLWMAKHFPDARIFAISNSASQKDFIDGRAADAGVRNVEVHTVDINDFDPEARFDRIVSIEMFEHLRNYRELFSRIRSWLRLDGLLFVHIFCHRTLAYTFGGAEDGWLDRYFFSGGMMPAADTFLRLTEDLDLVERWLLSGTHYQRTANAWLLRQDRAKNRIMPVFEDVYGKDAKRWFQRWRIFFMACAELFGHNQGQEWLVAHYLFRTPPRLDTLR